MKHGGISQQNMLKSSCLQFPILLKFTNLLKRVKNKHTVIYQFDMCF